MNPPSPLPKPGTEHVTLATHGLVPASESELDLGVTQTDSTQPLAAPVLADADATMCVRSSAPSRTARVSHRIAGYEILEELGRGGMGVVYKAWQHSLQRPVAVKMVLAGAFAGAEDLQRFRAEAMAIARLHHPNLLNIFEIGECDQLPFYAMEYMEGGSLAHRLNGQPIAPHVAASLVRSLAQAMDYAHKNGIVHRDLKPANILLSGTLQTPLEDCVPKITDFGIAKHLDGLSNLTRSGDILGTPHYMAPEQAMGRSHLIGPAVDIYSLGAILYELTTGRPPFEGHSGADVILLLAKEEPERPAHWQPSIPRDLETICLKCLEKDPAKRYVSAAALADDLERFLQGETIHARPASVAHRAVKWTRRRPAMAAMIVMGACLLLLSFGMMAMFMQRAVERAEQESVRSQLKDELLTRSKGLLADAFLERGIHLAEKGDVRRGMHWMLRSLEVTEEIDRKRNTPSELAPIIRMNLSSWGQCVSSRELSLPHTDWVWDHAFSPDQQFIATGSKDKRVKIWHTQTGKLLGEPLVHDHPVWGVAFHPDGQTLFTICGEYAQGAAGQLRVWSAHPNQPGHFAPRGEPVHFPYSLGRMLLHPKGDRVWVVSRNGVVSLLAFDPDGAGNGVQPIHDFADSHYQLVGFSADGATLAAIAGEPSPTAPYLLPGEAIHLWDARTGEARCDAFEHNGPVRTAVFSTDHRYLIVGAAGHKKPGEAETSRIHVWDIAEQRIVAESSNLSGRIKAAAMAPNGQFFAVSVFEYTKAKDGKIAQISDGHVGVWQLHANGHIDVHGAPMRTGHVVWSIAFSPDSRMLLAGCENAGAFLFSVSNSLRLMHPVWHEGNSVKVAFSPDGRLALTGSAGGGITVSARLWEVPRFAHIGPPLSQPAGIRSAYWENDGSHVWVGCMGSLSRWDPVRGAKIEEIPMTDNVYEYHSLGDDRRFIADLGSDQLREYDRETQRVKQLSLLLEKSDRGYSFDFHREQKIFVQAWGKPSKFRILDKDGHPITRTVADDKYEIVARRLSPRGDLLAVSQAIMLHTNRVVVYNAKDLSVRREIPLKHPIHALAFAPDGKTIALGGKDRQIQRYDLETGAFVGSPLLHEGVVHWAGYLGNDRLLATNSEKGLILLWDVKTGKRVGPAFEHRADLASISAHPHGKYLLTATHGKMAHTWRIPEPLEGSLKQIKLWVETMTGMEMNAHDTIVPLDSDRLVERRQRLAATTP